MAADKPKSDDNCKEITVAREVEGITVLITSHFATSRPFYEAVEKLARRKLSLSA